MSNNIRSMKSILVIALLSLLLLSPQAFSQTTGSIRGTIADVNRAVIPDASVTARNVDTNVTSTATTNNAGVYNFSSLIPGTYEVLVEAPGFATSRSEVRVRLEPLSLNFEMKPSAGTTVVDVTTRVDSIAMETSPSTGTVIQDDVILALPNLSNNVLNLINIMGGVEVSEDLFNQELTTFAGVPASGVSIMRDGIAVNEVRYSSGIATPSRMNTEIIGEIKLILSPVDAELGGGSAHIITTSRSGANNLRGTGVWNIQNTALDSVEWEIKARDHNDIPDWRNLHNYTLTLSGPIVRDKVFFFSSWDHQIARTRAWAQVNALTQCARYGIYRYLEGVGASTPGNFEQEAPSFREVPIGGVGVLDGKDLAMPAWGWSRPSVYYNDERRFEDSRYADGMPMTTYTWNRDAADPNNMDHLAGTVANTSSTNLNLWVVDQLLRRDLLDKDAMSDFLSAYEQMQVYDPIHPEHGLIDNLGSAFMMSEKEAHRYRVTPDPDDLENPIISYSLLRDATNVPRDYTETNRLMYQSVLGPMDNNMLVALGGVGRDANNFFHANEDSWVFNNCEGQMPREYEIYFNANDSEWVNSLSGGWDTWRNGVDKSGFISKYSETRFMPLPNYFYGQNDPLNTAAFGWVRTAESQDTIYGNVMDSNRKSIQTRIDYNINWRHRLGVTYQYERNAGGSGDNKQIPTGYTGSVNRRPQVLSFSLTSTLASSLMNEVRGGLSRTNTYTNNALTNPDTGDIVRGLLLELIPSTTWDSNYNGVVLAGPQSYTLPYFWGSSTTPPSGGVDDRWTFGNTVTYTRGTHIFRGGVDFRLISSRQDQQGSGSSNVFPRVTGGVSAGTAAWDEASTTGIEGMGAFTGLPMIEADGKWRRPNATDGPLVADPTRQWQGLTDYFKCDRGAGPGCTGTTTATQFTNAYNLLGYMSGSVTSINQFFYVVLDEENDNIPRWNNPADGEMSFRIDMNGRELAFFFKDDWRITPNLTLNLGGRWDYYGLPWVTDGRAGGIDDGLEGLYGVSRNLANWMSDWDTLTNSDLNIAFGGFDRVRDGGTSLSDEGLWAGMRNDTLNAAYRDYGSKQIFIGPNSPREDVQIFNKDLNNFSPAVGFSWSPRWLGNGLTTIRAGYSISYNSISNYSPTAGFGRILANAPGMNYPYTQSAVDGCLDPTDPETMRRLGPDGIARLQASGLAQGKNPATGVAPCYMSFENIAHLLPIIPPAVRVPMGHPTYYDDIRPDVRAASAIQYYDPNIRNPYSQSLNMSITRNIGNVLTFDVRYIGTLSRKSVGNINVNQTNYINNGLFDEFWNLRAGVGDPKSLDDFPILNSGIIPYRGCRGLAPDGSPCADDTWHTASLFAPIIGSGNERRLMQDFTGAEQVLYNYWTQISQGNFQSVASSLYSANFTANLRAVGTNPLAVANQIYESPNTPGEPGILPTLPSGYSAGQVLRAGYAPDNLIRANPQYDTTVQTNRGRSHYHSMQTQVTLRPIYGLNFQSTFTWSKSINRNTVLDWGSHDWKLDSSSGGTRLQLNTYGTYTLPFGAQGFFFRDVTGWVKKAIEGWQVSWIGTANTGAMMSVNGGSQASLWDTNKWVQVGEWDPKNEVTMGPWDAVYNRSNYFRKNYIGVEDPVCSSPLLRSNAIPENTGLTRGMRTVCNSGAGGFYDTGLLGFAERVPRVNPETGEVSYSNRIIYQNALPGEIGNVQNNNIPGPGRWGLDATMAKSVMLMEGKSLEVRIDAQNIFNHARPSYDSSAFGGQFATMQNTTYGARAKQVADPWTTLATSNGSTPFGHVNSKAGHRTFQARIRITF